MIVDKLDIEQLKHLVLMLERSPLMAKIKVAQSMAQLNFILFKDILSRLEALENPQTERNDDG